jgi:hypothetical protein
MLGSGNPLDTLTGLLAGQVPAGLAGTLPLSVSQTPDGELDAASVGLGGSVAGITFMDDVGVAPVGTDGSILGPQPVGDGLGGRSLETIDVEGPLGVTVDALFAPGESHNGEASLDLLGGFFSTGGGERLAPSSLEHAGATGPLGIDLDVNFENGTGSGLTSLLTVANGDVADAGLLDGPGGRIDTLSLQGPVELLWDQSDGGETFFPLTLGDNGLIGASLLDNFSNTNTDALELGILGSETIALDDILGNLFG